MGEGESSLREIVFLLGGGRVCHETQHTIPNESR